MLLFGRESRQKNKKKTEVVLTISGRNANNMQQSTALRTMDITEVHMSLQKQLVNFVGK